ncbi:MAG TPA: histidine kinase [Segetibacter sp.]|jgi:sensor histidine kinase YesM
MNTALWQRKLFWGISLKELALLLSFYFFMATAYYIAIVYNTRHFLKGSTDVSWVSFSRELMDYGLKFLLTIPLWWLVFRGLKAIALWKKLMVHFVTLPLFVLSWRTIYYYFCDKIGYGHLNGDGSVWDIYIPGLFYAVQFGLFHMINYYNALQKQQKLSAELKQLAVQNEMNVLKAQIQPHFLFNTLNSISAAVPPHNEHTRELIAKLADVFRYAMNAAQKELITLEEELDFIKNSLVLEQERFRDRLKVVFDIDPRAHKMLVPPMLLQPIIENAIKHGISKSVEGGVVSVKIFLEENKINFEIRDTGAGLNGYSVSRLFSKGIGLSNTRQRLKKLYNEDINIVANTPKGTTVSFNIPFTQAV